MLSLRKAFLILGLVSVAGLAQATPVVLDADHFTATYDSAQTGLYKQGFLSGSLDTVYFQPNTYTALSGGSAVTTPASLQLTVTIDPGYSFAGLSFTERGDYFLLGGGAVGVAASVQLVNPATSASAVLNLAPGLPLDQKLKSTPWELTGSLSPLGLGAPQTLLITLDNTLFASSPTAGLGFIQKTYAGFRVMTEQAGSPAAVPEPSGWTLLLAGMMAAQLLRRWRGRGPIRGMNL